MSHETPELYLFEIPDLRIHKSLRTIMRGKSARVGSGFCSQVSEESFFSVQLPIMGRVWLG
jgi:hypothetical protein